jgi:hypothetical protein
MVLLADPKVRNWLEQKSKAEAAAEQAATAESASQALDGRLAAIREHIVSKMTARPSATCRWDVTSIVGSLT